MKKLLLLALAILMITVVSAVPPQATTEGWIVRSAIPDVFMLQPGIEYDFHAHVFDATTGNPITDNAACWLHVYDDDGTHLFKGYDNTTSNDWDYSWKIQESNFTFGIEYTYIMQCNGTYATDDEGGFFAGSFNVNNQGIEFTEGYAITYIGLLAILCFLLVMSIWGIAALPSENQKDPEGEIIGISHLKYLRSALIGGAGGVIWGILFISGNIADAFLPSSMLGLLFINLAMIMGWIALIMIPLTLLKILSQLIMDSSIKNKLERNLYG